MGGNPGSIPHGFLGKFAYFGAMVSLTNAQIRLFRSAPPLPAETPLRKTHRTYAAPKISLTSANRASRSPNTCPSSPGRRPASRLSVRSQGIASLATHSPGECFQVLFEPCIHNPLALTSLLPHPMVP